MVIPELSELKYKNLKKYLQNNYPEFYNFLVTTYRDYTIQEATYLYYNQITIRPICKYCGNSVQFLSIFRGYRDYCCMKCKASSDKIKEKIKQTNIERYGVDNVFKSKSIQEKIKQTNIERYGIDNVFKSKSIQEKIKQTNIERYGGIGWGSNLIKNKTLNTYKNNFLSHNPDIIDITYNGGQLNTIYKCKCNNNDCNKCKDKTYEIDSMHYWVRKNNNVQQICPKLYPIVDKKEKNTIIEVFVKNLLDEYNIEYQSNVRGIIGAKELDIYIPSKNIAIECNGIYWHSSLLKSKRYHFEKYHLCEQNGIQLLTIWEDWIVHKSEIVKSIILSKLGIYHTRIYARKCQIKKLNNVETFTFLENNHIQGKTTSSVKYGLVYRGEIVSIMTFNKKKSCMGASSDDWELSRFCTLKNTQVIGAAEKLLSYFYKEYRYNNIVTYASKDISNGHLYEVLGFEKVSNTLSYWYIDPKTYQRYHRYNFTKHKLIQMGYDKNLSESQIMTSAGYFSIYDSGQFKYKKGLNI